MRLCLACPSYSCGGLWLLAAAVAGLLVAGSPADDGDVQCAMQLNARVLPKAASPPPPSILVVGDQGCNAQALSSALEPGKWVNLDRRELVSAAMAEVAAELDPVHIVGVGDNIYEDGANGSFVRIHDVWYDAFPGAHKSLQRPWHMVQGNHDWRTSPKTQIDFTWSDTNVGGFWNLPSYWYKKQVAANDLTIDLFYIDTNIWLGGLSIAYEFDIKLQEVRLQQKRWLEDELKASTADWKIVSGHHVMYGDSIHESEAFFDMSDLNELLQRYEVAIWLNGHDHNQEVVQFKGVTYITTGAGCKDEELEVCKQWNETTCSTLLPSAESKKFFGDHGGFAALKFRSKESAELVIYGNRSADILFTSRISNHDHSRWLDVPNPTTSKLKRSCQSIEVLSASACCSDDCCSAIPDMHVMQTCTDFCEFSGLSCVSATGLLGMHYDDSPVCELGSELGCDMALGDRPAEHSDLVCHCLPKHI